MSQIRHFHYQKRGKSRRGHCDMSLSSGQCDRFVGFKQSNICHTMRGNTVQLKHVHERVCYTCSQCDYKKLLKQHVSSTRVDSIYEGVWYSCSQWVIGNNMLSLSMTMKEFVTRATYVHPKFECNNSGTVCQNHKIGVLRVPIGTAVNRTKPSLVIAVVRWGTFQAKKTTKNSNGFGVFLAILQKISYAYGLSLIHI